MVDLGIVIVNYNTCALLRKCLHSVYASAGDFTFDVSVVDNASSDGSAEMVVSEFPQVRLIVNTDNMGYPHANNQGLKAFGFGTDGAYSAAPSFALLLNPDTELPPDVIAEMLGFMAGHPDAGMAGPKLVRPDGSLDLACRRSFPTPEISFYRMVGLSRLFPRSRRFARYNLTHLDPDVVTEVDSVVGAFLLVRDEVISQVGLLDDQFFMYGEDLDWAYRTKQAGWKVLYNPAVTVLHVKRAATRNSPRAQLEFYRAMEIFYHKYYSGETPRWVDAMVTSAIKTLQCVAKLRAMMGLTKK